MKFNIYKRKDGRYEGRYVVISPNGSATRKYVYGHTREEVEEAMKLALQSMKEEENKTRKNFNANLKEIAENFLETKRAEVKENSLARYSQMIYCYVIPSVGKLKISNTDRQVILDTFMEFVNSHEKPLAERTKRDLLVIMNSILDFAYVIAKVRADEFTAAVTQLSDSEIIKLLSATDINTELMIKFVLYTGVRVGEITALKWKNIDFEARTISINNTVQRIYYGSGLSKVITIPIKQRTIPISNSLYDLLIRYRNNQKQSYYVVTNSNKITEPRTLQYRLMRVVKKSGVNVDFSGLRDTFAIKALNMGVSVKYLAEFMGIEVENTIKYVYFSDAHETKVEAINRIKYLD